MRKKWFLGVSVGCLMGVVAMGIGFAGMQVKAGPNEQFSKKKTANLEMIIQKYYMGDLNSEEMLDGVYRGYVYGLEDSGTRYLNKNEYAKASAGKKGEYLGTGIEFTWGISNQNLIVTGVVPKSPAEHAGIVVGDKIVAIDGVKAMMSNEGQIYDKLTYAGKDPVKYTVESNDGKKKGDIVLVADVVDKILIESRMVSKNTGYIKIDGLAEGTVEDIDQAIKRLEEEGAKKLILDLRSTESNDLKEVNKLADLFVEKGELFAVKGKNDKITTYEASKGAVNLPLGVIVNQYTSGAVEGFVTAMESHDRGVVVGEPTSGKGTIQELVPLKDGTGLYITTKLILDADGNLIKDKGVVPDVLESVPTEDTLELVTTGKLSDESDTLLQKAIEAIN